MQYNGSTSSVRAAQKSLISEDILWISQSHNLTSTGVIQHSEMSLSSEHKLELETHHSSTIFCDMMSPDEWKSSLPMVLQQNDASGVPSPTSPSNSIENLVLELENSNQDIDMGSPFTQCSDSLLLKVPFSDKYEEEELVCNMDTEDVNDMLFGMLGTEKEIDSDTGKLPSSTEKQSPVLVADAVHTNKGIENRLTSPDPLSIGLFAEDSLTDAMIPQPIVEAPTTTPDSQPEATEDVPKPPNDREHSSLPCLTSLLAEVIHCNSRDDATSTISTLRQQACDLMSTYSQLKFQNDELMQQQNLLQSEQSLCDSDATISKGCPLTIEVLIPFGGAKKAFGSAPLYHHIPIEDGQIPITSGEECPTEENVMDEPYEEQYDAPMVVNPTSKSNPCQTKKLCCELGCICSSLQNAGKLPVEHCKNPDCMLEPNCTRSGDPSHTPKTVFSILKDEKFKPTVVENSLESNPNAEVVSVRNISKTAKVPVSRSRKSVTKKKSAPVKRTRSTTGKPKENEVILLDAPKIDPKDIKIDPKHQKLLRECEVRLTRIDPMTLHQLVNGSSDVKLYSKCFVHVKKLQPEKNQTVYCMVHRLNGCICLGSTTND
ncbi:uncharacterized protein LOC124194606 isoform X2 [Daphnia pulex]|uniref:uncharacterized protein LOC124194606 isoform X2 n=1 Tax=Daphnia pulex TaxID=6669 RepID=UPI001EDF99D8|nr:uncharacterized protein LOC124194606 isoform X2 [Daphnia pulex]